MSTWSPSCSRASGHVTGDGRPWTFALVDVMGPYAFARRRGIGWAGTRIAIRPSGPTIGAGASGVARRTTVKGPGRFFAQNASAVADLAPNRNTSAGSA